jgi:UDP-N-acetyl-D-galactosamine dehydrogenase
MLHLLKNAEQYKIAIIGLGYVGLPLAHAFSKRFKTTGFDINEERVAQLRAGIDHTAQLTPQQLNELLQAAEFSSQSEALSTCNVFIVTVPTPVDTAKKPDLGPLLKATKMIAQVLKKGDLVIYESTVYPGCTEEACIPLLEAGAQLQCNVDFGVGYSPERINPGDTQRSITSILKVTSGSTPPIAEIVDWLYASVISAGTHLAPSIKVAEAAKAIENAQRDLNISFMNELAVIFDRMGLDTNDVLEAAGTKWNFLPFKPGLVGGHCIGVDPYYLTYKSIQLGYHPDVILSGRRVNDQMGAFIVAKLMKLLVSAAQPMQNKKVLIAGFTFKENCPDTRNTRVIDMVQELEDYGMEAVVWDPIANRKEASAEYGIHILEALPDGPFAAVIVAVAHEQFRKFDFEPLKNQGAVIFDVKGFLPRHLVDARL